MPDFRLERAQGAGRGLLVVGLDEAGRGPWAGPVMAAAAWLDSDRLPRGLRASLDDCKKLPLEKRLACYERILEARAKGRAAFALASASVEEIDRLNILEASLLAMRRAAEALSATLGAAIEVALVDGNRDPRLPCRSELVIEGDGLSLSIAAASIVAKVERDRHMELLSGEHPGYGWEHNRGYGTRDHQAALASLGVTPYHRRSFRPIRELLPAEL